MTYRIAAIQSNTMFLLISPAEKNYKKMRFFGYAILERSFAYRKNKRIIKNEQALTTKIECSPKKKQSITNNWVFSNTLF